MFIKTMGAKGKEHVYLMQSYREDGKVKTRIVQNFGRYDELVADDPDAYEKLRKKYRDESGEKRARETEAAKNVIAEELIAITPSARAPEISYAYQATYPLWKELELPRILDALQGYHNPDLEFRLSDVAATMSSLKLWDPGSVLSAYRHKADLLGAPLNGISLDQMYFVLDFLSTHKDTILKNVNRVLDEKLQRSYSMVFYDVTNAYFECPLTDEERGFVRKHCSEDIKEVLNDAVENGLMTKEQAETFVAAEEFDLSVLPGEVRQNMRCRLYLRMRGLSKEHRYDLPLISMALIIDDHAIPIDYEIYSGCASEYKTMSASIMKMKSKYNVNRVIVVADRGLNSTENMKMLLDEGNGFLVAQKISNLKPDIRRQMLDPEGYTEHVILRDKSKPATDDNIRDRIRFKTIDFVKYDHKKGLEVPCKLVFTHGTKRQQRDLAQIEADVKKARDAIAKKQDLPASRQGWVNYVKTPQGCKIKAEALNQKAIEKKTEEAGYAGIIYHDVPGGEGKEPTPEQLMRSYHHLVQIEDCFRIMKHNTKLRPMFVRTEDHINGHALCCVLALIMLRRLQMKLDESGTILSVDEIVSALRDAKLTMLPNVKGRDIFLTTSCYRQVYKNRERLSDEELRVVLDDEGVNYDIDLLLKCQGLNPLPTACDRQALTSHLKMRLSDDAPLVEPTIYDIATGKVGKTSKVKTAS